MCFKWNYTSNLLWKRTNVRPLFYGNIYFHSLSLWNSVILLNFFWSIKFNCDKLLFNCFKKLFNLFRNSANFAVKHERLILISSKHIWSIFVLFIFFRRLCLFRIPKTTIFLFRVSDFLRKSDTFWLQPTIFREFFSFLNFMKRTWRKHDRQCLLGTITFARDLGLMAPF